MNWPKAKLGEVCVINPRLPKGTDESQNVSFLTMSSVSEKGLITHQETRVLSETKKGFTYFERNDILLAKITPCFENGKAVHTSKLENEIGYGSTEFHVLRPVAGVADGKYIFYLVWNDIFRFHGECSMRGAAGQKRVTADFLKQFEIPLPPLAEQQKIAAILDAADHLRQKDQQLVEHYTALGQSLFLEMFGDPVTNPKGWGNINLESIADIASGITKGRKLKVTEVFEIPYMRVANVQAGYLSLDEIKTVPGTAVDIVKFGLKAGDVLLTEGGDPDKLGRGTVWNDEIKNCIHQNHIFRVRLSNDQFDPVYLSWLCGSEYGKRYFLKSGKQTTGIASINKTQLTRFPVLTPPLDLQYQFAQHIEAIKQQKQQAQAALNKSETLFNSLLQRAFKGELTQSDKAQSLSKAKGL